jgi:sec-independent protein translocase protein TatC
MIHFHINEIQYRFIYFIISFISTTIIIWQYKHHIIFSITPINLIFTSITEAFYLYIYFTILIAFITNIPYLYIQLYSFIIPGFYKNEIPQYLNLWIILYFIPIVYLKPIIAFLFQFFTQFQSQYLTLALTFQHFIHFINQLIFLLLVLFIIPFAISYFKTFFINRRKLLYFSIASILAIITPPDLFSLIFTLIPIILFTEFIFFI